MQPGGHLQVTSYKLQEHAKDRAQHQYNVAGARLAADRSLAREAQKQTHIYQKKAATAEKLAEVAKKAAAADAQAAADAAKVAEAEAAAEVNAVEASTSAGMGAQGMGAGWSFTGLRASVEPQHDPSPRRSSVLRSTSRPSLQLAHLSEMRGERERLQQALSKLNQQLAAAQSELAAEQKKAMRLEAAAADRAAAAIVGGASSTETARLNEELERLREANKKLMKQVQDGPQKSSACIIA